MLVDEAGGACVLCGYDRFAGALQFHHVDPSTKRFDLSLKGVARSLDTVREEAQKCVVLCANCHAEVEGGVTLFPLTDAPHSGVIQWQNARLLTESLWVRVPPPELEAREGRPSGGLRRSGANASFCPAHAGVWSLEGVGTGLDKEGLALRLDAGADVLHPEN